MEQLNMFAVLEEQERERKWEEMYHNWLTLPEVKRIPATSPERPGVQGELAYGYCKRWLKALHRCPGLPDDRYIWLNEVEPAEYWVMNRKGEPAGEHIDTCPFCGADLKHGGGDVVLHKADDGWWRILGFIKEGEHEDDEG